MGPPKVKRKPISSTDEANRRKRSIGNHCSVPGCSNYNAKTKGTGVSYHKFPSDPTLQKLWALKIQRFGVWNPEKGFVCSNHFNSDDFERDLKAEMLNLKKRKILKAGVVPSINLPKPDDDGARMEQQEPCSSLQQTEDDNNWISIGSSIEDTSAINSASNHIVVFEVCSNESEEDDSNSSAWEEETSQVTSGLRGGEEAPTDSVEEEPQNLETSKPHQVKRTPMNGPDSISGGQSTTTEGRVRITEFMTCEQTGRLRAEIRRLQMELKARDDSMFILEQSSELTAKQNSRQILELKAENERLKAELKEKNEKISTLEEALATDTKLRAIFSPDELKRFLKKAKKWTEI